MGNAQSSEYDSSSDGFSSEGDSGVKVWTAKRAEEEGFTAVRIMNEDWKQDRPEQLTETINAATHNLHTSPFPENDSPIRIRVGTSGSKSSQKLTSPPNSEPNFPTPESRLPRLRPTALDVTGKTMKTHCSSSEHTSFDLEGAAQVTQSTPAASYNLEENPTTSYGSQRFGLACMACLQKMGSTRRRKPFSGCLNQPGRHDDVRCQDCVLEAKGCHQPPKDLENAAWTLQTVWQREGRSSTAHGRPILPEAVQAAWQQYIKELDDFKLAQAEHRLRAPKVVDSYPSSFKKAPRQGTTQLAVSSDVRALVPYSSVPSREKTSLQALLVKPKTETSASTTLKREVKNNSAKEGDLDDTTDNSEDSEDSAAYNDKLVDRADALAEQDDDFLPEDTSENTDDSESSVCDIKTSYKRRHGSITNSGQKRIRVQY